MKVRWSVAWAMACLAMTALSGMPMVYAQQSQAKYNQVQLRVSEALEAVSQSFKDQPFLGTELCGQQIMDWFGSVGLKE